MKFQKINDNVIKCVMSREEMHSQGINIDDLMDDRIKAEEFLQYILNKAKYEVDFHTNGDVLNVQLSVMKDGGVSMMISDDQNAAIKAIAEQFKEKLREFSKVLDDSKSKLKGERIKVEPKSPSDIYSAEKVIRYFVSDNGDNGVSSYNFWARLSGLEDCIAMAKALSAVSDSPSSLYKYYGEYYLSIKLTMDKAGIAHNVFIMSEYSDDVSSDTNDYLMVGEHGDLVIKDKALSELSLLG